MSSMNVSDHQTILTIDGQDQDLGPFHELSMNVTVSERFY
jgi:hypothetical protein